MRSEVELFTRRVSHWGPSRWAEQARAERVHLLVQRLADLCADAEGEPRRAVPRLDNDLALVDQVRVLAADIARVAPAPVQAQAVRAIAETSAVM